MKALFVHDHIFRQDVEGNLYTAGSFNNDVWKRYLKHFQELTVVARLSDQRVKMENTYNKFDLKETNFKPVPSLSGPIAQFKSKQHASDIITQEIKKVDCLIARLPSETGNLAIDIAKQMGKPYVVEVVACVWDALWNHGSLQAKVYAPIAMGKMKNRIKNAPYIIYVTNEFLQNRYPSDGITENISNVEIEDISEESYSRRIARYYQNKQLYKIGMIGSLKNNIKGLDDALKALKILHKDNIDFSFEVLGDGEQTKWRNRAIELGIDDKVKFCGVLPSGDPVLKWMDEIDLYIQPSYQEGLPRAVIEAMSRGCPVVGSSAGGIPELIDKGCIHAPGSFKKLAEITSGILENQTKAKNLSFKNIKNAKQYSKNNLDNKRKSFVEIFLNNS